MTDGVYGIEEELNDYYTPIRVGDVILGWFQPYETLPDNMAVTYDCDISVVMGQEIFELEEISFYSLLSKRARNPVELEALSHLMHRQQSVAIKVPPGSLDVSGNQIALTERSAHNLYPALINFDRAFHQEIQRHFNTLLPVEAIHECIKLTAHNFDPEFLGQLTWRGRTSDEIISSTMTYSSTFSQNLIDLGPQVHSVKRRASTLRGVANLQIDVLRSRFDTITPYPFPKWIYLVVAESEFQACQIEAACRKSNFLETLFESRGRTVENNWMTLFIARPNDPFIEWIDGEIVSASTILELSSHLE